MGELGKKNVVVVGASKGIGFAAAEAAANEGAHVVMISKNPARLAAAAASIAGDVEHRALDMLDRAAVETAIESVGSVDHLVLSAVGDEYALFGPIASLTDDQLERSFDKLRGFVAFARAAAPRMAKGGSITLISGAGAARPPKETALAAASNASVVALGKSLAVDLAPIRANVVMPGLVDTDRHGEKRETLRDWATKELPARRIGQPKDIADAILFVMKNPYMTGHTLVIDGGFLGQ